MADIFNMADTWNNAGTTFTAILMNVTDTASNANSLLLDLQVGGSSRFRIAKDGSATLVGNLTGAAAYSGDLSWRNGDFVVPGTSTVFWAALGWKIGSISGLDWGSTGAIGGAVDLSLRRDAANTLAQRNGVNAQAFRVYNTFTDVSNYERGFVRWSSNVLEIGSEALGTGSARLVQLTSAAGVAINAAGGNDIIFRNGGTNRWLINSANHFLAATDNSFDIGASGANRPRDIYIARDIYSSGGTQAIFRTASAITSGAGANTGTLTNAPAAGNPTKWIPINDNGTTRYIPAW